MKINIQHSKIYDMPKAVLEEKILQLLRFTFKKDFKSVTYLKKLAKEKKTKHKERKKRKISIKNDKD